MGYIPAASNASEIDDHSHPSYPTCRSEIPSILQSIWWWNPYITFNIASVTTQLLLPYSNTVWTTALYIISRARTVDPVFNITFTTTPHRHCDFLRFSYRVVHLLLLNRYGGSKYGKAVVDYRGSRLTVTCVGWLILLTPGADWDTMVY